MPATALHVLKLYTKLRPEDAQEVRSSTGRDPLRVLGEALRLGQSWAALDEIDNPVLLFGVAPGGLEVGVPWMVASTEIEHHAVQIARLTRPVVEAMNAEYPVLTNWADTRNTLHLRWLAWAGFSFTQTSTDFAADGTPFVEFIRIRNHPQNV